MNRELHDNKAHASEDEAGLVLPVWSRHAVSHSHSKGMRLHSTESPTAMYQSETNYLQSTERGMDSRLARTE